MSGQIHVAFAVDGGYLRQAAVTIASIIANSATPDELRFYIVHGEDEACMAEQLAGWSLPNVTAVPAQNTFAEVGSHSHVSKATFLRTMLPGLLPHLDRVIYLDADLIVLNDIRGMWDVELGDAAMAGVSDFGVYIQLGRYDRKGDPQRRDVQLLIGLDPDKPQYVNSGVLVMDLQKLREMDFSRKFREMDEAYRGRLIFVDQDIINSLMVGRMKKLDPRWNVSAKIWSRADRRRHFYVPRMLEDEFALQGQQQWLVHWTGRNKPWADPDVFRGEDWWRYAALSGLDWRRPASARRGSLQVAKDHLLDLKAGYSALRYRIRQLVLRDRLTRQQ